MDLNISGLRRMALPRLRTMKSCLRGRRSLGKLDGRSLIIVLWTVCSGVWGQDRPVGDGDYAFALLSEQVSTVVWDAHTRITIDINCDGNADFAFLGAAGNEVAIAIMIGPIAEATRAQYQIFKVGQRDRASLCKAPVALRRESSSDSLTEAMGPLPGYRPSAQCPAFALDDPKCGAIHFYWNSHSNSVGWWRR